MNHISFTYRYICKAAEHKNMAELNHAKDVLQMALKDASGSQKIELGSDQQSLAVLSTKPLELTLLQNTLRTLGFEVYEQAVQSHESGVLKVSVDGMTCHSCELIVERAWKKLEGVRKVEVHAASGKAKLLCDGVIPTIEQLQHALGEEKYYVRISGSDQKLMRISWMQIVGMFALVLVLGKILSSIGLFKNSFAIGNGMSLWAIFVVGLVAASSSCIAISGGLLLSSAARFNERYGALSSAAKMRPVLLFIAGRVIGYGLLGGLLGLVGEALAPSPLVTAVIAVLAAVYMIIMGLDMLQIAPTWLKRLMPRMPKSISHRVLDAEGRVHPLMPFGLGAATFFLPCGFTQALQLYALTTGSFVRAALSLGVFALGTAPALIALGWASSSLKGKAGKWFFSFSGALVVVLGFWNIQNGFALAGYPLRFPTLVLSVAAPRETVKAADLAPLIDGKQVIKMNVSAGYQPSHFTIRAGTPVRWEIDATHGGGCASVLVSRQLGIQKTLELNSSNVIEFTPTITGEVPFSCSMGMYRGSFTILSAA